MIQKEIFWGSMVPTLHCLFILKFNLKYLNNFPIYILYNLMHLSLFYDLHETAFPFTFCYIFQFLFFQFIKQKKISKLFIHCQCLVNVHAEKTEEKLEVEQRRIPSLCSVESHVFDIDLTSKVVIWSHMTPMRALRGMYGPIWTSNIISFDSKTLNHQVRLRSISSGCRINLHFQSVFGCIKRFCLR